MWYLSCDVNGKLGGTREPCVLDDSLLPQGKEGVQFTMKPMQLVVVIILSMGIELDMES